MHLPQRRGLARSMRAAAVILPAAVATVLFTAAGAYANVALTQVSTDPYTDTQAQHRTEVEPDTFTFGNTIVSAFQVGRVFGGGSSDIGFATSTDGGTTWTHGFLPGITTNGGGTYGRASDAAVAFDARHNVWLISSLGISGSSVDVLTSRSTDGGPTWANPVTTATGVELDKNWIVCDNTSTSPFYGNCYTEYDVTGAGNALRMKTSHRRRHHLGTGARHRRRRARARRPAGGAAQRHRARAVPVHQRQIRSFRSIDGGASWRATVLVSTISHHTVAGGLREEALPSAEIDAAGTAYVVWQDCRFRSGCPGNDIVMAKSTSETTWAAPTRVPIDATTSAVDHFIPGIGVDRATSGSDGPARPDLLLLPQRQLHRLDLPAQRRLHLLHQRRHQLERADPARRADEPVLDRQHQPGPHGRRLHLHLGTRRRQRLPDHPGRQRPHRLHVRPRHVRPDRRAAHHRRHRPRHHNRPRHHPGTRISHPRANPQLT